MSRRDHQQVGALCYRKSAKGHLNILLVTSRDTGRWVIPKGWPEQGQKSHRTAALEALEEAGALGEIGTKPFGTYIYDKPDNVDCKQLNVAVFPMHVTKLRQSWPEEKERVRKWFSAETAAKKVDEPELAALIKALAKKFKRGELTTKS